MKKTLKKSIITIIFKVYILSAPFSLFAQESDTTLNIQNDTILTDTLSNDSILNINRSGRGRRPFKPGVRDTIFSPMKKTERNISEMKIVEEPENKKKPIKEKKSKKDTIVIIDTAGIKPHSPKRATYLSMACPGLGQIYNKKYWKLPIIYGGFTGCAIGVAYNTKWYKEFKTAYIYKTDGDSTTNNDFSLKYSADQLLSQKDYHRKNLELSYILAGLTYILNIVDAAVDAHLYDFNVSEDLSIKFEPTYNSLGRLEKPHPGLKMTLKF